MKTILAILVGLVAIWLYIDFVASPLRRLFETTAINRVEIENRTLRDVALDVVKQVEVKRGKEIKITFSPDILAEKIIERNGGVLGNPPIEGCASEALHILSWDYACTVTYLEPDTLHFYIGEGNPKVSDWKNTPELRPK